MTKRTSIKKFTQNRGFTLTEILIVMSILGLLLSIVSRNQSVAMNRSKDAALMTDVRHIRNAVHQYALDHGGDFPPDLQAITPYVKRPIGDWQGAKASGLYSYNPANGQVTLFNRQGSARELTGDSKGIQYGDY